VTNRLADHTTLRIGGPVGDFILATTQVQVIEQVIALDQVGRPLLLIGGGSNLVCGDEGFDGTVLALGVRGLMFTVAPDFVEVVAACGESWDDLVAHTALSGWAGIEALSGIPGLVGATPIQNVGAYGQDVSQTITQVRALDRMTGLVVDLTTADCAFTYRGSIFKEQPERWVVLEVTFRLIVGGESDVRYAQLAEELGIEIGATATPSQIREAVLRLRRAKGMVLDPDDPDTSSAGSFFTNPIVGDSVAATLPLDCPRYPAPAGVKVSAAWLIEHAGVTRGWRARSDSRAAISSKHTLAIANLGGASASEVIELASAIKDRVQVAFGIELEAEPRFVNCELRRSAG
jgi:UDP-N-acetylmuramate dehydrogenase